MADQPQVALDAGRCNLRQSRVPPARKIRSRYITDDLVGDLREIPTECGQAVRFVALPAFGRARAAQSSAARLVSRTAERRTPARSTCARQRSLPSFRMYAMRDPVRAPCGRSMQDQRKLQEIEWSPGQESNLDLTLRRRVHCPLCYREASAARGLPTASPRSIRAGLRASQRRRLLNKRAGQPGAVLAPFKSRCGRCYPHGLWIKSCSSSHLVAVAFNVSNAP
jgi:hypothetical protein